ncbi:MAG TPA: homocysteine S-methyltransferase family protein [Planctomycetota bacterium]|nr:homocysteine S-methyltransferase family protein [Planctomycetota bacterium]
MNRSALQDRLRREILVLDGGYGTTFQQNGLKPGQAPEGLMLEKPDVVEKVHRLYVEAGADIVLTNTFGACPTRLEDVSIPISRTGEINRKAVELARRATKGSSTLVAGNIGPSGKLIAPLGELTFDDAIANYAAQVTPLVEAGVDLIVIETIIDLRELKAIVCAVRDRYDGFVIAQMAFNEDGRAFTGTEPEALVAVLEAMDVDCIGANCSVGPDLLVPVLERMGRVTATPLCVEPNAGLPRLVKGQNVWPGSPDDFTEHAAKFVAAGCNVIGSCCGSTPDFTRAIREVVKKMEPTPRTDPRYTKLASRFEMLRIGDGYPIPMVGERINPTGRKRLKEELKAGNFAFVREEAVSQVAQGASLLDCNVGVGGLDFDEPATMVAAVRTIQSAVRVPVQVDSPDIKALELGLKEADGKPIVNSVSLESPDRIDPVLPLIRRYGAAVLGLAIGENGIPDTWEGRLEVAERIVAKCLAAGIRRQDIVIDCITMPASADPSKVWATIRALREVKDRLGVRTALGVSNVSFGLPRRPIVTKTMLAMALANGLDFPIVNPGDAEIREIIHAANLLQARDPDCARYLDEYGTGERRVVRSVAKVDPATRPVGDLLYEAIVEGDRDNVLAWVDRALGEGMTPMDINNLHLVRGMNEVGRRFNDKIYFLPQVILSAETMQKAFAKLRPLLPKDNTVRRGCFVVATVRGDVHDIGKNIVAAVMENHGWEVHNLGKNVPREDIAAAALAKKADIVGLSALMTTTMIEMKRVIDHFAASGLAGVKILIGGAVTSQKYADEIAAAGWGRDAVDAVHKANCAVGGGKDADAAA